MTTIFRLNNRNFEPVPAPSDTIEEMGTISAGLGGVWGTTRISGEIFTFTGRAFRKVPGELSRISVGNKDNIWGLNQNGEIFRFNQSTGLFDDRIPGSLTQLRVGGGGVWGINSNSEIFEFNAGTRLFELIRGALTQLAVGDKAHIFGINASQEIFRFNQSTRLFDQRIEGSLTSIGASGSEVWGLNDGGQIFRFNDSQNLFLPVPGQLEAIVVGDSATVWGLANINEFSGGGLVFEFSETDGLFHEAEPGQGFRLMSITAAPRGQIIIPGHGGQVWGLQRIEPH